MFGLSKYAVIGLAISAALAAFTGWRWLEVRETLAVERAQFRQERTQFEHERSQFENRERINRETEREYQTRVAAMESDLAAVRTHNRGLQLIAYRPIPSISIPARIPSGPAPQPERDSGTPVDLESLYRLAANCQADASQLASLQQWIVKQGFNNP